MSIHGLEIEFSVDQLSALLGTEAVRKGDFSGSISGIASLEHAEPGDLSFLANPKYRKQAEACRASVILVPQDMALEPGPEQSFFVMEHPSLGLARICGAVESRLMPRPQPGIDTLASISPDAQVADDACVGPFCVVEAGAVVESQVVLQSHVSVGRGARVGSGSYVYPFVSIYGYCTVGAHCRVHSGTVIGSDGFGYSTVEGVHHKEPQIGTVVIEDDVEIGANVTIDRARFDVTRIGRGAKIDNLVQIAHNVDIGQGAIVVAQVGISGSSKIGNYAVLAGQAGIAGHLSIGDQALVGAQAGVNRDVGPGEKVRGTPHQSMNEFARIAVLQKRLPDFFRRLQDVEARLGQGADA